MDAPLAGHLYFDPNLFDGHYFIVGPDDPVQTANVLVFCCTSKDHGRPSEHGCHAAFDLPSFHIEVGHVQELTLPTWVQLDEAYPYARTRFTTNANWQYAKEKLTLPLTVEVLRCAAQSEGLASIDASACEAEADLIG